MKMKYLYGFSLLSLLVAISIAAILAASVAASYQSFIHRHRMTAIANTIVDALQFARSEAMFEGGGIRFCPLGFDQQQCGTDWGRGQLLIRDRDHRVLRVYSALPTPYVLHWRSRLGMNDAIAWDANGFTQGQQGSFWVCFFQKGQLVLAHQIILLQTGQVRMVVQGGAVHKS